MIDWTARPVREPRPGYIPALHPHKPGFAPASRSDWCKGARVWLRRQCGLSAPHLAAMLGMSTQTIHNYANHLEDHPWLLHYLAALSLTWRPTRAWAETPAEDRKVFFLDAIPAGVEMDVVEALGLPSRVWNIKEIATKYGVVDEYAPLEWEAMLDGTAPASCYTPRIAALAEAYQAGFLPSRLPFNEWTT